MNKEEFCKELKTINIDVTDNQLKQLEKYYQFLSKYNENVNLTAITEESNIYLKHFYDSILISKFIDFINVDSLVDVGTGAGFPGVVLKIFFPNIKLSLIESNNKKTTFLKQLIEILCLDNVTIINQRVEDYAKNHTNEFDMCISRAVAYIDIIASLSLPLIKKEGKVVLMKGCLISEREVLEKHQKELFIKNFKIIPYSLPITRDERNIIILEKNDEFKPNYNYNQLLNRNKKWKIS